MKIRSGDTSSTQTTTKDVSPVLEEEDETRHDDNDKRILIRIQRHRHLLFPFPQRTSTRFFIYANPHRLARC